MADKQKITKQAMESFIQSAADEGHSDEDIIAYAKDHFEVMPPTFWERHPNVAGVARGALATLPVVGAVAGETLVPGPLGFGGGAAVGEGARGYLAEGLGLDKPTAPLTHALRIGGTGVTNAAMAAAMPAIVDTVKNPLGALGDALDGVMHPQKSADEVIKMLRGGYRTPAPLLTRPGGLPPQPITAMAPRVAAGQPLERHLIDALQEVRATPTIPETAPVASGSTSTALGKPSISQATMDTLEGQRGNTATTIPNLRQWSPAPSPRSVEVNPPTPRPPAPPIKATPLEATELLRQLNLKPILTPQEAALKDRLMQMVTAQARTTGMTYAAGGAK